MPHHNHPAANHTHFVGSNIAVAHGFIVLHPIDPAAGAPTGAAAITALRKPGVRAQAAVGVAVVYVEDTAGSPMTAFHDHLGNLANTFMGLQGQTGAPFFNFEHHF